MVPAAVIPLLKVLHDRHRSEAITFVYLLAKMTIIELMDLDLPLRQIHAILLVIVKIW